VASYDVKINQRTDGGDENVPPAKADPPAPPEVEPGPPSSGNAGNASKRRETVAIAPAAPEDAPVSVRIAMADLPTQIEIRDSVGKIRIHDLPTVESVRESLGDIELRDSVGPIRRDSLGMRVLKKDSWAPEVHLRRRAPVGLRDFVRSVASWVLLLAVSIDLLALLLEPIFVSRVGASFFAAVAVALAAIGLAFPFAVMVAVPLAATHALVRHIGRQRGAWRHLWPTPLLALGWFVVTDLAPHKVIHSMSLVGGHLVLAALFSAALIIGTLITRIKRGRLRIGLGLAITLFALVMNLEMSPVLTHEPRDLLWLCTVFCFASVFYPLRRQAVGWPHDRVSRVFGIFALGSVTCLLCAPLVAPDWRTQASMGARFAPRLARFARKVVDLDGDGFSAIAWGTDCDDSSAWRNPAAPERADGNDRNCNGKTRPVTPTSAQRGLAPPAGEPDASRGDVDRVVVITIDCFRDDSFTAEYVPNLAKLAERGLRFGKLYSSGARTAMSLPYLLRGAIDAPTVAELLAKENVTSSALFGYRHPTLEGNVFDGFQTVKRPSKMDQRIRAPELTDLALDDLRDPAHAKDHFLWVHYFDAHGPRNLRVLPPDVPTFPPMVGESDDESALYLSELSFIDRHVERLIEGIEQLGGADGLARSLIIVTNDHGEGFGKHGVFEHGVSAFEAITHAPGLLVAPGITPGTYPHVVAHRDIAATVMGAFGLVATHPQIETFGRSWLRLRAAPKAPLHEFVVTYETTSPFERWGDAPMASVVDDRGKLSVSYVDGIIRLYRLDHDPNEDYELARSRPDEVARYRDELELYRDIDSPPR
jgi:arylsulfatase A-like enzyme